MAGEPESRAHTVCQRKVNRNVFGKITKKKGKENE